MINRAIKSKLARKELEQNRKELKQKIKNAASTLLNKAMRSHLARKDFKEAQDTYWPAAHQEKIRKKKKRI